MTRTDKSVIKNSWFNSWHLINSSLQLSTLLACFFKNIFLSFPLDCSGWFGGLPWWWGWRGRRWRRAVSEEAAPPELLRLIVLCLIVADGHWVPPILPPLVVSLVLGLPVPPVSLTEETGKDELPPHSVPPDLCSSFLPQWKEMESFSFAKKDRSVRSFSPLILPLPFYQLPPLGDHKNSFFLTDPWQTQHSCLS